MTVGSLFAGIGGFDLGFERAGFDIKWQVEIDPFCRAVLARHFPAAARFDDVRTVGAHNLPAVDVLCGGFPCQPHSLAGRRGGSDDERDLWPEYARLICELKPRWVVAENVPGLLSSDAGRFFGTVLGDLAACGYDAEWDCLPASAFGAPHRRDRVWLVAYPHSERREGHDGISPAEGSEIRDEARGHARAVRPVGRATGVADAEGSGLEGWRQRWHVRSILPGPWESRWAISGQWESEPNVGRVAHGIPARVDRLRGLGNAIVPQIAEWIAERIKDAEGVTT